MATGAICADLMIQLCIPCMNLMVNLDDFKRTVHTRQELISTPGTHFTIVAIGHCKGALFTSEQKPALRDVVLNARTCHDNKRLNIFDAKSGV